MRGVVVLTKIGVSKVELIKIGVRGVVLIKIGVGRRRE